MTNWRNETCGTCGWAKIVGDYPIPMFVCRRRSSDIMWPLGEPACPAYDPREELTDDPREEPSDDN